MRALPVKDDRDQMVRFFLPTDLLKRVDEAVEEGRVRHGWTSRSAFFRSAAVEMVRQTLGDESVP